MKPFQIVLVAVLVVILAPLLLLAVEAIRLGWWAPAQTSLPDLTPEQKAADMQYLLDLTRQVSSADLAWTASGLDNPLDHPEEWLERARQTQTNADFVKLILQYTVHLGQVGHAYLAFDYRYGSGDSLITDIPKWAFETMPLWQTEVARLRWYAHASLDVVYQAGHYLLAQAYRRGDTHLPAGTQVIAVDGLPVDEFVLAQQYDDFLHYDPLLEKWFMYPLFKIDPGADAPGWQVTFRLPDGSEQSLLLPKISGFVSERPPEAADQNIRCLAVDEQTFYVRIASFDYHRVEQDARDLRACFDQAPAAASKLILDVRGNIGGEIWSYMDNLLAPLVRTPLTYQTTSAIKESFYTHHGWRFWLYERLMTNKLTDPHTHLAGQERLDVPGLSDQGWRVVRLTRTIEPAAQPYPFEGQIYVLTDRITFSAADSFAAAMQRSGLGTVLGANTNGAGEGLQAKTIYALPNSGIMFYLENELILNPDGAYNNVVGTQPDVWLDASSYPTPFLTKVLTLADLQADPWVGWVVEQ